MTDQPRNVAKIDKNDLLSFTPTGRSMAADELEHEFGLMNQAATKGKGTISPEVFRRVAQKSGTHLIKMVSPRADGGSPVLRVENPYANHRFPLVPAGNAADIPYAKVLFRPLDIHGETERSFVDHVRNPTDISKRVFEAFASVFGEEAREAVFDALLKSPPAVETLAVGEFPIIFVPRSGGGDLQITPVSPATAYMAMKRVTEPYFQKQAPGAPRGRWQRQKVSDKLQNISGAIDGPRIRFFAEMPPGMAQEEAELFRFVHGGSFPRQRDPNIAERILKYADRLDRDKEYNDMQTRAWLDRRADWLIEGVSAFVAETMEDAKAFADLHGISHDALKAPPVAGNILLRRYWAGDAQYRRARMALSSAHFAYRLGKFSSKVGS